MAKDTNDFYIKLLKKFKKYDKSLKKFCDSRKPKLNYNRVRQRFLRLKKDGLIGDKMKSVAKKPKEKKPPSHTLVEGKAEKNKCKLQDPATVDRKKIAQKNGKRLTSRKQRLLEQELSTVGKTHAQMAKDAGFKSANLSKAFTEARQGQNYQEALAKSKAELRAKIGIPGEFFMTRLAENAVSRPSDLIEVNNGEISVRTDIDFSEGADLAIGSITIKTVETTTEMGTETRREFKFEPSDARGAILSMLKIGGYFDDSVYNSLAGGNEEILDLWGRFQQQEITANDLSMQLAMRGLAVPSAVQLQAKAELVAIAKGGGDDDVSLIDLMDSYDEMLEDSEIAKKKAAVEAERKKELEIREIELEALNREDDNEKS